MKKPRKPKLPEVFKSITDVKGNQLICKDNGKRIAITLKLVAEKGKGRRIGVINPKRRILEVRRNREEHLFRKFNGYGFNHKLLSDAKRFDNIMLNDNYERWLIPKQFILESKKYLNFLNGGFELQVFVSLDEIEQFKRKAIV